MVVNFVCNYIYVYGDDGWSPESTRLGGSEEFIVEVAKRLARKGHTVTVFHNGKHGIYDGVEYKSHEDFFGGDVVINVNFPEFKCDTPQILWTSLTKHPDLSHFKAVCYISEYARDNTGIKHDNLYWVPPGFDSSVIKPSNKIKKQCFYGSSPDRGLDTLLEAWPQVYQRHPDATLLITYGAQTSPIDGVINLGEVDNDTMNEIIRTSEYWCHPCNGGELYCMTGIKAQAAGCVPVVIPEMALIETVKSGYFANSAEDYADTLIKALDDGYDTSSLAHTYPDWDDSTNKLLKVIEMVYNRP